MRLGRVSSGGLRYWGDRGVRNESSREGGDERVMSKMEVV